MLVLYKEQILHGGIGGYVDTWHDDPVYILDSYNIGEIIVKEGAVGGIFGSGNGVKDNLTLTNCYNAGMFKYTDLNASISSYGVTKKPGIKSNIYCLDTVNAKYFDAECVKVDSNTLKSDDFAASLGELWVQSTKGFPILRWQLED